MGRVGPRRLEITMPKLGTLRSGRVCAGPPAHSTELHSQDPYNTRIRHVYGVEDAYHNASSSPGGG